MAAPDQGEPLNLERPGFQARVMAHCNNLKHAIDELAAFAASDKSAINGWSRMLPSRASIQWVEQLQARNVAAPAVGKSGGECAIWKACHEERDGSDQRVVHCTVRYLSLASHALCGVAHALYICGVR